jgi:ketopantoate reductase
LPCGWSKVGLQTFNKLAKEVYADCQKHGEEFDKAFKERIEQEMASTNKTGKRKRNYIDTYNDLNQGEQIMKDGEESDEEDWVRKYVFTV